MRYIKSDKDCADCLCRVCARNSCNDSYNHLMHENFMNCVCDCGIGDYWVIETIDDCPDFLEDEGWY